MDKNREFKVIYSLGLRCITELSIRRIGLKKFSSIFGSLNIKKFENIIDCINSNFKILLKKKNYVPLTIMHPTKKKPSMRLLHKKFDDIKDWGSSTIPHHNILKDENREHFKRGIKRFNNIKKKNIPTLFINISSNVDFNNTVNTDILVNAFIKNGWNNFLIIFIYFNGKSDKSINVKAKNSNKIIYEINDKIVGNRNEVEDQEKDKVCVYLEKILKEYNLSSLLSVEEVDKL